MGYPQVSPSPVPHWGCRCIRQSQRLLGFHKYLHQPCPLQWGGHKLEEKADTCQTCVSAGAGPSPSVAPQPSQGGTEGFIQAWDGFVGPWHPSTVPSLSPAWPQHCQDPAQGRVCPLVASSRSSGGTGPAGGTAPQPSPHGKSGDFQALGKNRKRQWVTAARHTPKWSCCAAEPMASGPQNFHLCPHFLRVGVLQGPAPQNSHFCPHFLTLAVLQGPAAWEGLFLERPGCFPGTLLL